MAELDRLKGQIKSLHIDTHREKEMIVEDYSQRVAQLEASLSEKDEEVRKYHSLLEIGRDRLSGGGGLGL